MNLPIVRLSTQPIESEIQTLIQELQSSETGAQVLFLGQVRGEHQGRKVQSIFYDSFQPLAEKIIHEIIQEMKSVWSEPLQIGVVHRTGKVKRGELSIILVVGSAHRDTAYQASRMLIEEMKKRVPIWKQEFYEDGGNQWLKGQPLL